MGKLNWKLSWPHLCLAARCLTQDVTKISVEVGENFAQYVSGRFFLLDVLFTGEQQGAECRVQCESTTISD